MNKNKSASFNVSNAKTTDSASERKPKSHEKLFLVMALISACIMTVGIISILVNAKRMFESGDASVGRTPLIVSIIITVAGGAMMALFIVLSMVALIKESKNGTLDQSVEVRYVIDPAVLKNERIKQLPEVQRLMQYESVQKAFFEGKLPSSRRELADPHLQELVNVLSQLADENGVIRL